MHLSAREAGLEVKLVAALGAVPGRGYRTTCFAFLLLVVSLVVLIDFFPGFHDFDAASVGHAVPALVGYHGYSSPYSFNAGAARLVNWMADMPDAANLTSLTIPGTHDTLTFDLADNKFYQCQNTDLASQLRGGVRYVDVRARIFYRVFENGGNGTDADEDGDAKDDSEPKVHDPLDRGDTELRIYHGHVYTGYTYADVLLELFAFLEANPSEAIIMRLKEEGEPIRANTTHSTSSTDADEVSSTKGNEQAAEGEYQPPTFEEMFNHYRMIDKRTALGSSEHLFIWPETAHRGQPSWAAAQGISLPTLGSLRGKILMLQEFPYVWSKGPYGVPWALSSDLLQIEDKWIIENTTLLEDKWIAISDNLAAAAAAEANSSDELHGRLFLTHLSASVGVTPIEAAAGPLHPASIAGMNDRTGAWLEAATSRNISDEAPPGAEHKAGVVIIDFPGKALLEAVVARNDWLNMTKDTS